MHLVRDEQTNEPTGSEAAAETVRRSSYRRLYFLAANLSGADFAGADLRGASFYGANLSGITKAKAKEAAPEDLFRSVIDSRIKFIDSST